jgi:hypothetical protein
VTKGGDIASASPLVIDTDGSYFDVTGTTNFAAMTVAADRQFTLQFDGALTMTHHATNLDLPGEANITTAAGDVATFQSTGADTVQCINYTKADGTSVVAAGGGITGWDSNNDTGNNDLLPDSASAGIYLGVNSATSSNLLDDYEEGTFNPTITCSSSGSFTTSTAEDTMSYTKIGRIVHIQGQVGISGESSPNGQIRVSLPFTTAGTAETSDASAMACYLSNHGGSYNQPIGHTEQGETYFRFFSTADDGTLTKLDHSHVDTVWYFSVGGFMIT